MHHHYYRQHHHHHTCITQGQLSPLGQPTASLQLVREISMLDVGRPLQDIALVPAASQSTQQQEQVRADVWVCEVRERESKCAARPQSAQQQEKVRADM
eukprot:1157501-Pelagomonas_calceolata.AAC.2